MNKYKSHFVFTKSQQNGIFLLVLIIISLQLVYFFYPFSSEAKQEPGEQELVERLQRKVDSLKQIAAENNSTIATFNPNFISDFKGYMLGLSVEEIDRLHEYRAGGNWINSSEDFQKVTGVSDSLLQQIAPAFRFPAFTAKEEQPKKVFPEAVVKQDLNAATASELQVVNGIGEKLSERIVNYRESLGGFRAGFQAGDVYGLSPEVVAKLLERFEVVEKHHEKYDLNEIEVIPLSQLPYFNYELARAVVNFRKSRQKVISFEDLEEVKGFPLEKLDRIKLYLTID